MGSFYICPGDREAKAGDCSSSVPTIARSRVRVLQLAEWFQRWVPEPLAVICAVNGSDWSLHSDPCSHISLDKSSFWINGQECTMICPNQHMHWEMQYGLLFVRAWCVSPKQKHLCCLSALSLINKTVFNLTSAGSVIVIYSEYFQVSSPIWRECASLFSVTQKIFTIRPFHRYDFKRSKI